MTDSVKLVFIPAGSPASARGFSAIGVHAGFRPDPERLDMALVVAAERTRYSSETGWPPVQRS